MSPGGAVPTNPSLRRTACPGGKWVGLNVPPQLMSGALLGTSGFHDNSWFLSIAHRSLPNSDEVWSNAPASMQPIGRARVTKLSGYQRNSGATKKVQKRPYR